MYSRNKSKIRGPLNSVYQSQIKLNSNFSSPNLECDNILLNCLKAFIGIKLLNQYSLLISTFGTDKSLLLNELKEIKRIISSQSHKGYECLLNTDWHKELFTQTVLGRDALMWHSSSNKEFDSDLACIYQGQQYITENKLEGSKFVLLSDESGPSLLWFKNNTWDIVITFPIIAIRIFPAKNNEGINALLQSILLDKKYDLTQFYELKVN
jgi:hypothetical protein